MNQTLPIRRALLSVSDKEGIVEFARVLVAHGAELLSTGGTAETLRHAGLPVTDISDYTGFPEILGGRVKTLSPHVHGGLLALRDDPGHLAQMAAHGLAPIDLVAVNLYPFEATAAGGADVSACIENIDIGGPAMVRSAAKNHASVVVCTEHQHLLRVAAELETTGGTSLALRRDLAAAAFARTSAYDAAIAEWFSDMRNETFPERLVIKAELMKILRYGENPHQLAALYRHGSVRAGICTARKIQGKDLSYNNILDADAAIECVAEFENPAIVIVKHCNPCGVAEASDLPEAWEAALRCDPVSAFGGVIAANRPLDAAIAHRITGIFTEVVVAPDADEAALAIFARKSNIRLLLTGGVPDPKASGRSIRSVAGGFLVQTRDNGFVSPSDLRIVTKRAPTRQELNDLIFAFRVCKHVKSNAIVYAKNLATVGIGAGQMSRVDAARLAGWKSQEAARESGAAAPLSRDSVVASDAFFPFADGLEAAVAAGATAVIQPGGSLRDGEVIAAADQAGLAMVFTGLRHFRH